MQRNINTIYKYLEKTIVMRTYFLLCLLLYVFSLPAYAQVDENPNAKKLGVEDLLQENKENDAVSVASKSLLKIAQAPSVVSLVHKKQIEQYGFISINDVLYRQPSFLPTRDYDRRTVSARGNFDGWNANHILLLVDGVPMNDIFLGTAFTSEVTPLVFTKSLEIIRGTGSALYGSNAMNGVVNMRTLRPADLQGNIEGRCRIGNNGTFIYDVVSGGSNQYASFVLAFNRYSTQGEQFSMFDGSNRLDSVGKQREYPFNDKRTSNYVFLKLEGRDIFKGFSFQFHNKQWSFGNGIGFFSYAPDQSESMHNARQLAVLRYNSPAKNKKIQQEYVVRYQKSEIDWNARIMPDSLTFNGGQFPLGMTEHLKTNLQDVFTRAQWNYQVSEESNILLGVENTLLSYKGDEAHYANVNFSLDSIVTNPNNKMLAQNSSMAWIQNRPVLNTSIFVQYVSPRWFNRLQATIGLRYDAQLLRYLPVDLPDSLQSVERKSFHQFSPRLSLVFNAHENLTFKAMAGKAFRTPSMGELFGINSYLFTSNFRGLKPEFITSFELQGDWHINGALTSRSNIFYTIFENQIDYSDDIIRNLYTLNNAGFESELLFNSSHWSGFLNYSFVKLLRETVQDTLFLTKSSRVTSLPTHSAKAGVSYHTKRFYVSLNMQYQNKVYRRSSDKSNYIYDNTYLYRPEVLPAWFRLDLKTNITISKGIEVGVWINNVLNTKNYLIRRLPHAFDYRMDKRNFLMDLKFSF